ncbi:MAG: class I SAM-dependent RNA methyltransferase [Verrucomicrobia bacterium]|nr:class I SAM-dependent RNA methyltransferase [Verrucomicrobiota bacterium]
MTIAAEMPVLKPGDAITVTIADIAFGGDGVARVNELVVFVPFVLLGEVVAVEITEVRKSFARARLVKVVTPSPDRVTPECRYYGECGGCQYQHVAYPAQLRLKRKQVADLLQRIGGFAGALVDEVVPCPAPYGYRNRLMLRSQWNKAQQKLEVGFLRNDNKFVISVDECKIAEPVLNEQIKKVRANPPPKGGIKVALRIMPDDWQVGRDSFFQTNFPLLPGLVAAVRGRLADAGSKFLVDAYCGVGFFSIELADLVERYVGIEYDVQAIKAARLNALSHQRANGEYLEGKTEELLPGVLEKFPHEQTTIILDPPRTGCVPSAMQLLQEARVRQVLYVSCHPATLARDLQTLCAGGAYELVKVTPVDMFPQTQHVECVADLRLKDEG